MPITFAGRFALSQRWAGPLAKQLQPLIKRVEGPPQVRNALDGVWLGAPLHPALTDVPVGAWTAALALDTASVLTGDEALGDAADRVLAVGALAALPAAATGLNDLRDLIGQSRQVAMVHALLNVIGLSFTSASVALRFRGRRGLARGLSATGYLISASAAHLGGKLSFGLGIRAPSPSSPPGFGMPSSRQASRSSCATRRPRPATTRWSTSSSKASRSVSLRGRGDPRFRRSPALSARPSGIGATRAADTGRSRSTRAETSHVLEWVDVFG